MICCCQLDDQDETVGMLTFILVGVPACVQASIEIFTGEHFRRCLSESAQVLWLSHVCDGGSGSG